MAADRSKARFFTRAAELLFTGRLDWLSGDWRCSLFDSSYSPDWTGDTVLADMPVLAVVASQPLVNRRIVDGMLLADGVRFAALAPTLPVAGFIVWQADHPIDGQLLVFGSRDVLGLPDELDAGQDYVLLFDMLHGLVAA